MPELRDAHGLEADLVAEERHGSGPIAEQTSALTAAKDSRTTASAASLVTRRPSTNLTSSPARSSSAEICGPAPWTTQTSWPCASASASVARLARDRAADLEHDPAHVR